MKRKKVNYRKFLLRKRSKTGLGIFTTIDISKGQFLLEYLGKKIPNAQADKMTSKYLFEVNKRITLEGASRKNFARYVNHSCRPNCEIDIKKEKVLISSKRKIKTGEELNYDYGKEYFNGFIKPYGCKCLKCVEKRAAKRLDARNKKSR
jgi:SET domain-containing protein